ncbi:hypothetical protein DENSPDRAFT_775722, partial [Dentipellis sp. KUC8613]
ACQELFDALNQCHDNLFLKWTGGCNQIKLDLNHCLHSESVARSSRNREDAKLRRARREQALKDLHEND